MDSNGTQYSHSLDSSMRQCSARCSIPANSMLSTHQQPHHGSTHTHIAVLLNLYPDSREVWLAWTHLLRMLCNKCCCQEAKLCHLREYEPECQ